MPQKDPKAPFTEDSSSGSAFPAFRDISQAPLEALMQGLGERGPATPGTVESWIAAEGYYPGTTRVPGPQLYAKYLIWLDGAKPLCASHWGKVMSGRFKKGKSNTGYFYYISRESLSEIEGKLSRGGFGNLGGVDTPRVGVSDSPNDSGTSPTDLAETVVTAKPRSR